MFHAAAQFIELVLTGFWSVQEYSVSVCNVNGGTVYEVGTTGVV